MIELLNNRPEKLLLVGNFNVHLDNKLDSETQQFLELLKSFDLTQYVSGPTHEKGHTLDLAISRATESIISDWTLGDFISDHCTVDLFLRFKTLRPIRKQIQYRKLKNIDIQSFKQDILVSELANVNLNDPNILVEQYNGILSELLEKHAPLKNKTIVIRQQVPWFNDEIKAQKLERRNLENQWRKLKQKENESNRDEIENKKRLYKVSRTIVVNLINNEKVLCYNKNIENCERDKKQLFKNVNELLCNESDTKLPDCDDEEVLANNFNQFFVDKIQKIRDHLNTQQTDYIEQEISQPPPSLTCYKLVSEEEVAKYISKASNASCSLDPIPTRLLKDVKYELLPILTKIINSSLLTGVFPCTLKNAIVKPHLKKTSLDQNNFKNFRPVSNLPFFVLIS